MKAITPTSAQHHLEQYRALSLRNKKSQEPRRAAGVKANQQQRLSEDEIAVLERLKSDGKEPESVVIFCDVGRDQDDELALATMAKLHKMGNIKIEGVITNLGPSDKRAQLAKGALSELGLHNIPIAAGSSSGQAPDKYDEYEFDASYMAPEGSVSKNSQGLLKAIFRSAEDKSVNLVALGPMTDLYQFMATNQELFAQKAESGIIMGGVRRENGEVILENGRMVPDSANNNTFDKEASDGVYAGFQDMGIPTTILTREAAYAAPADKDFYDGLGATNHEVGKRLRATQRRSIEGLWARVNLPGNDPDRIGLPARCDRAWFEKTFCDKPIPESGQVWDSITKLPVYDAVAGLASAGPDQVAALFTPKEVKVNGVNHYVIGVSKEDSGMGGLSANTAISALAKSVMLDR